MKEKKTVSVYSKVDFREEIYKRDPTKTAFISIEGSPDCIKYRLEEDKDDFDNDHILSDSPNVFNIEFDDVPGPGDYPYKGHWMKAMTGGQGAQIVTFIERNLGKDFVIHCKAGKSRSKAVGRFILDIFGDQYENGNPKNPIEECNVDVLEKLKNAYYSKHHLFWHANNELAILKEAKDDVGKYVHWAWGNPDYPGNYDKVEPRDLAYLLGAVDGADDYYWVSIDRNLELRYTSACMGYTVIYNPTQYTNIEYEEFMDGHEDLIDGFFEKTKEMIKSSVAKFENTYGLEPDKPLEDHIIWWINKKEGDSN